MTDRYARKVPAWVVQALPGDTLRVVVQLATHADADGIARPPLRTLAAALGKSPSTIAYHLRIAVDAGILVVSEPGTPRRATRWGVLWLSTARDGVARSEPVQRAMGSRAASDPIARSARPHRAEQEQEHDAGTAPTDGGRAIARAVLAELEERRGKAPQPCLPSELYMRRRARRLQDTNRETNTAPSRTEQAS